MAWRSTVVLPRFAISVNMSIAIVVTRVLLTELKNDVASTFTALILVLSRWQH
jgi:hypothetical protein